MGFLNDRPYWGNFYLIFPDYGGSVPNPEQEMKTEENLPYYSLMRGGSFLSDLEYASDKSTLVS